MKLLAWIAALLLLLGSLLLALPFSATGTRLLVQGINQSGLLQVEYRSGSLFGDLGLQRVALQLDGVDLAVTGVDTRLDIDCFWHSVFCFDELRIESLRLELTATEGNDTPATPQLVQIPFSYRAPALEVAQVHVAWPGGSWQQRDMQANLQLADSVLEVFSANISSPELFIEEGEEADAGFEGFEPPAIFMPLGIVVSALDISDARVHIGEDIQRVERLSLSGAWREHELRLAQLKVEREELAEVSVHGELQFRDNWPVSLAAATTIAAIGVELLDHRQVQLSLEGDLQQLMLEASAVGEPELAVEVQANPMARGLPFEGSANAQWPEATTLGQILGLEGGWAELELQGPVGARFDGSLQSQRFSIGGNAAGLGYQQLQFQAVGSLSGSELELTQVQLADRASQSQLNASGQLSWASGWALATALGQALVRASASVRWPCRP